MSDEFEDKLSQATEKLAEIVEPKKEESKQEVPAEENNYTEVEQKAMEFGWKPEGVEGKEPKSAEQFMADFEIIKAKRKNKELEKAVNYLVEQQKTIKQKSYEQALAELQAKRTEAIEIGDTKTFNQVDQQYQQTLEESKKQEELDFSKEAEVSVHVEDFQERNKSWFNDKSMDNKLMMNYAITYEDLLAKEQPELSLEERFKKVETEVRKRYPDHEAFKNVRRDIPSKVSRTDSRTAETTAMSVHDLSREQREAYEAIRHIVARGGKEYTVEDFLKCEE